MQLLKAFTRILAEDILRQGQRAFNNVIGNSKLSFPFRNVPEDVQANIRMGYLSRVPRAIFKSANGQRRKQAMMTAARELRTENLRTDGTNRAGRHQVILHARS